ncbi:two-component system, CitB family, sensor kinase [Jiangella alba]|uniref:histidine kinase n=2 Tax=Jiangella alba TaxID=561176 RepID=A0A1H5KNW4_9ACTN|nr:two-component system, CitB family, sensor kinase [Jiangella alba]
MRMLRSVSLRVQLLALQLAIVLVTVVSAGGLAAWLQAEQIRDSYQDRMIAVADSVAGLPSVLDAFDDSDPSSTIQPLAELIREASNVTYVVVTDEAGIRYSHPDPERIGEPVSTDPSVPLSGEVYVGTQTGTLGRSWRVKVPVFDAGGAVIGTVSVGTLESELQDDLLEDIPTLLAWLAAAAVLGTLGATWVTHVVRRRIFKLEPDEIATLLETRDAMLHGIREGVVALDDAGRIALVNDEARRLLDLDGDVSGRPAPEVLEPTLAAVATDDADVTDRLVLAGVRILVVNRRSATSDGRSVGVVLTLRDRTELHDALRELEGARSLTEALRAQAHEFSNHLHVVSGLLELGRTDDAVSFIDRVGRGGTVTRTVADGVTAPAVSALLLAKAATCRERGLTLRVDARSRLDDDGDELVTILGNLVDNAADATGHGGTVDVRIDQSDGGEVRVLVADDGPGVPVEQRTLIFAAGFSSKSASKGAGRGIGLALVHRIVQRRGGRVTVRDSASGGAEFEVVLPARVPAGVRP